MPEIDDIVQEIKSLDQEVSNDNDNEFDVFTEENDSFNLTSDDDIEAKEVYEF